MKVDECWALGQMFQNGQGIAYNPEKRPHSVLWGILPKTALLSLSWAHQPLSDAL